MKSIENCSIIGIINKKYGHLFGDELLYQFAFSLEKVIKGSKAYHMNGTVFALILPCVNQHVDEERRRMLLDFLEGGIACDNQPFKLEYVAVEYASEADCGTAEQLYELLEYAASKAYRSNSRYIVCTRELNREMLRRRYLIERIQNIDRDHGFRVWYQPIKCMADGCFCSMEALVRMTEPDGSIISPGEFISLAEQTGMIAPLTWFVLEEACRLLRDHPQLNGVSVGINAPMSQILDQGFLVRVNSIVDSYGIPHERIGIEVTERELPENFQAMKVTMEQFTRDGYRFYLDDFGAGYSNFNCLLQLPFSRIKLDMNLIRMDIRKDGTQRLGLVKTLIGFLHSIGLTVIAEGMETEEAAQALCDMDIDRIQGFVCAGPMPEEPLLQFYEEQ